METVVELGYIGLTCFIWMLVVICNYGVQGLIRLRQTRDIQAFWLIAALASVVGIMSQGVADTVWYRPVLQTLWWLCVGIIASFDRPNSSYNK